MFDPPAKGPGDACTSDADCTPRTCEQTSVGKVCAQSCDPAAMPATCPANTTCMNVDGGNLCISPASLNHGGSGGTGGGGGGGGCSMSATNAPTGAAALFAVILVLAFRRRAFHP